MAIEVLFSNATGSDTAASGAGPTSALSGTSASFSGSVVTLDGSPDLSAFDASTWVLWLATSTGRQFFDLSSADDGADTVTTVDAPAGTASGLSWGIGGKRKTIEATSSRTLFGDSGAKAGWTITLEDDQTITSTLIIGYAGDDAIGFVTLRGATGHVQIDTSANSTILDFQSNNHLQKVEGLKFCCTNATKTGASGIKTGNNRLFVDNCIFGDATNTLARGIWNSANAERTFSNCYFVYCTSSGIDGLFVNGSNSFVRGCVFYANAAGISSDTSSFDILDCLFYENTGAGIDIDSGNSLWFSRISDSVIHDNGGDGITFDQGLLVVKGCSVTGNGGYGINGTGAGIIEEDYNNFGANTSGAKNNVTYEGANSIILDPGYADAAGGDFGGGVNLKAAGHPSSNFGAAQSATSIYKDIGIQQEAAAAGGGSVANRGIMSGGAL